MVGTDARAPRRPRASLATWLGQTRHLLYTDFMAPRVDSLTDILAPIGEAEFFRDWHDKRPLHVPAKNPDKFAGVMSWDILNDSLNMTAIWGARSLAMILDNKPQPPERYCRQAVDRNAQQGWQPDADKVKALLRAGASLVANDLDTLHPGMALAATALEKALGGKAQSNVYCSWAAHQAFDSHYDTHEVFAFHVAGEKVWRVYENRIDLPIAHPAFKNLSQEIHDHQKGRVIMEVRLKPGDLLYIPRGYYHDALADSEGTLHITFGITHVIGMDLLNLLLDHAVADPLFRQNFPLPSEDPAADHAHVRALAVRLGKIATSRAMEEDVARLRRGFRYPRGGFDLPGDVLSWRYSVHARDLKVVARGDGKALKGPKGTAPIPPGDEAAVTWIISQQEFSPQDMEAALPELATEDRDRILGALKAMKVISRV